MLETQEALRHAVEEIGVPALVVHGVEAAPAEPLRSPVRGSVGGNGAHGVPPGRDRRGGETSSEEETAQRSGLPVGLHGDPAVRAPSAGRTVAWRGENASSRRRRSAPGN